MKRFIALVTVYGLGLCGLALAQTIGPKPFISNVIRAADQGAYGDGNTVSFLVTSDGSTGAITFAQNGSNAAPAFTIADIGKTINLPGVGPAGVLLGTTISSVADASHITVSNATSTAIVATAADVTWGHDDTAVLQAALSNCRPVQLTDGLVYLTTGLRMQNCKLNIGVPFGGATYGFVAYNRATLRSIKTQVITPTYVIATENYVVNSAFAQYPFTGKGIIIDANNQAANAVISAAFGVIWRDSHFINATSHCVYEKGQTANGTIIAGASRSGGYYYDSDANGCGGDGIHVDASTASIQPVSDGVIKGGYWSNSTGYSIYIGASQGWIVSDTHCDPKTALGDIAFFNLFGGGTTVSNNIFNGNVYLNQVNSTWPVQTFGPGNSISGTLTANVSGSATHAVIRSLGNTFYGTSSQIYFANSTSARTFITEGDTFQSGAPFKWTSTYSSIMQVIAKDVAILGGNGGAQAQGGPCWLNGKVLPGADGQGYSCTDYEVIKTASTGNTSLVFTITATVPGSASISTIGNAKGGTGLGFTGMLDVTSWSASTAETYRADVSGEWSRIAGTTTSAHVENVSNNIDSGASITTSNSCSVSTTSTTSDSTLTCTITVTIPSAQNSNSSQARLRLNFANRQVTALTVQ